MFPNTDRKQCNKISEQDNVPTSEQPIYTVVKKKQKKIKKHEEKIMPSYSVVDKKDIKKKVKQREATPTSMHTTESPAKEVIYSVVKKEPKDRKADNEDKVPSPPLCSIEELYTAVKNNVKGSDMEEEEGAPQIPPHTTDDLYVFSSDEKPRGDSTDSETDGASPTTLCLDDC